MKNKNLKLGHLVIIGGSLCFIGTIVSISAIKAITNQAQCLEWFVQFLDIYL